jgi:hypothetical protein
MDLFLAIMLSLFLLVTLLVSLSLGDVWSLVRVSHFLPLVTQNLADLT